MMCSVFITCGRWCLFQIFAIYILFFLYSKMASPCYGIPQSQSQCVIMILSSIGGLGMIGKVISIQGWQSLTAVRFSCMVIFPFHAFTTDSVFCMLFVLHREV